MQIRHPVQQDCSHGDLNEGMASGIISRKEGAAGQLLGDLREAYLESSGSVGEQRDSCARRFDAALNAMSARNCDPQPD